MAFTDGTARCAAEFEIGPVTGVVRCELEDGHDTKWHRNDRSGWEWSAGQLWPLRRTGAA